MKSVFSPLALSLVIAIAGLGLLNLDYAASVPAAATADYHYSTLHSRDGIGKFYLGREIAKVMSHREMLWLERPSREIQEQPDRLMASLGLQGTEIVADLGAGTGYFSFRLAPLVPQGKVLAVEIQPEMLDALEFLKQENGLTNVETILGTAENPHLPEASVDLALLVDAYHEFEYPKEMMQAVYRGLKPGGKVVLVEYRRENPLIPIKALHKMTQRQAKQEMAAAGLVWQETQEFLPQQHVMFFEKPLESRV
ncbi:MAG: methyltransferase domain-containing protein [Chloroflexaceae bacterium]|nr:methyltransferase domain-containing protein [Chloroflexaceae bacterium]